MSEKKALVSFGILEVLGGREQDSKKCSRGRYERQSLLQSCPCWL